MGFGSEEEEADEKLEVRKLSQRCKTGQYLDFPQMLVLKAHSKREGQSHMKQRGKQPVTKTPRAREKHLGTHSIPVTPGSSAPPAPSSCSPLLPYHNSF